MFTADNITFDAADRANLNEALRQLLIGFEGEQRTELERSFSDRLNNAWFPGATVAELVSAANCQ